MDYTTEATRNRAKRLRRSLSGSERSLWRLLRANQLDGLHFRRQHPVGPYVLDFYCHAARLAVEVDGGTHGMPGGRERDERRDHWCDERGIRTLRLPVHLLENDVNGALVLIRRVVEARRQTADEL